MAKEPGAGPRRTCIGCRRVAHPGDLVRVAALGDGRLVHGTGVPGRGAWLCANSASCFDAAVARRAFARNLRRPVSAAAVAELRHTLGV